MCSSSSSAKDDSSACPFGGGVCGEDEACQPLHTLVAVQRALNELLHETTFEAFRDASLELGWQSAPLADAVSA